MPEPKGPEDKFVTWLKENPPPEDITARIKYGDGEEKEFHFKRSIEAYDRYIREISRVDEEGNGPSPLAVASMFLIDTVAKNERGDLEAFLTTFPGRATVLSNTLLDIYNGDLEVEIKNVDRTTAGPRKNALEKL